MGSVKSILIVGVGGQGTLLASQVLGRVLLNQGLDVKVSEVHGMSQRGGSVVTYVRYGDKVYSPVVEECGSDIMISFEQLEAARWLRYLNPHGTLITNTQKIAPMPVISGISKYPEGIIPELKSKLKNVIDIDALALAIEAGNTRAVNIVLLGVCAKLMGIDREAWLLAIKETVKPKFLDVNIKAFELGYNYK